MNPRTVLLFLAILLTIHISAQYRLKDFKGYSAVKINPDLLTAPESSEPDDHNNKSRDLFWFNLGLGGSNRGIAMGIAGSYQFKNMVFSTRLIGNQSVCFSESNPCPWVSDIALLFGYMKRYSSLRLALATGISLVQGIDRGDPIPGSGGSGFFTFPDYYDDYYRKFGVPIEVQVFAAPVSFMGAGLYLFGNINSRRSFFGVMVSLQLGIFNKQYQ